MKWQISNDAPVYAQLIEQIQRQIISGAYQPGERLPSVRDLAAHMERRTGRPVACIDTQSLLDDAAAQSSPAVYTADGVHPTPAGHWLLAQEWVRRFREGETA